MDAKIKSIQRRDFIKILALGSGIGLALHKGLKIGETALSVDETRLLMGTIVNLSVISDNPEMARSAIRGCLDHMEGLEIILSRYQPQSQLSQLNREGRLDNADPHLLYLIEQSHQISELSGGAFDITVKPLVDLYQSYSDQGRLPSESEIENSLKLVDYRSVLVTENKVSFVKEDMTVTLDGIAKGYIVDQGVNILRDFGFENVMVEAGGDLLASGEKGEFSPWQVGVQSPRQTEPRIMTKLQVSDHAVATSGDYMQVFTQDMVHHHIIDPWTGYSSPHLSSATILAPMGSLADGLATAVMVLGPHLGMQLVERLDGIETYLITKELQTQASSGLRI